MVRLAPENAIAAAYAAKPASSPATAPGPRLISAGLTRNPHYAFPVF